MHIPVSLLPLKPPKYGLMFLNRLHQRLDQFDPPHPNKPLSDKITQPFLCLPLPFLVASMVANSIRQDHPLVFHEAGKDVHEGVQHHVRVGLLDRVVAFVRFFEHQVTVLFDAWEHQSAKDLFASDSLEAHQGAVVDAQGLVGRKVGFEACSCEAGLKRAGGFGVGGADGGEDGR